MRSFPQTPKAAQLFRSHTVKPPPAGRLTECDIIRSAGGGYKAPVRDSIFPSEWYPPPQAEYITRWLVSGAQKHGTWVRVDIQGRPILVTVKRTNSFIDLSRGGRSERNLRSLGALLAELLVETSDEELRRRRSLGLQRLDQGLGDLIRVVRYAKGSGGPPPESRGRTRAARRASAGAAVPSTTDGGRT